MALALCIFSTGCTMGSADLSALAVNEKGEGTGNISRAKRLREALEKVNGVEEVGVIVEGNRAIIGIIGGENAAEEALREKILEEISKTDSTIRHTSITLRPTLVQMIVNLEKEKTG